jgi:hypothetical protein
MVYAALSALLTGWGGRAFTVRWAVHAAAAAAAFALVLELVKPLIVSREMNAANLLTSWAGCLAAIPIGLYCARNWRPPRQLTLGITALSIYMVYLTLTPFNFTWHPVSFRKELPSPVQLLPFYHYAMGATLGHVRLFVQSVLLLGGWTYLLRVRFGWFEKPLTGIPFAALFAGIVGLVLEGGQLFLPSRTFSVTDAYCFALGGALGAWIRHPEVPFSMTAPRTPADPDGQLRY